MASSVALRNVVQTLKISLIAQRVSTCHKKPVRYVGTISYRQSGERERQGTRQLEGVGGVIKFRMHILPNFFCLSDGLGLFLL